MKDSEFIGLLNLYLDHELSASDAARLEAEVQNNPARRKVYQQYCRMQKACKVLAADFIAAEANAAKTGKKVVAFDSEAALALDERRRRVRGFYAWGGLAAAAACVALVLVDRGTPAKPAGEASTEIAAVQLQSAATVVAAPAAITAPSSTTRGGITSVAGARAPSLRSQPTLVSDQLFLSNASTNALLTASVQDAGSQLAWIPNLQLAPLSQRTLADDLRFDARPTNLRPEVRPLGSAQAQPGAEIEMAAFRFVK